MSSLIHARALRKLFATASISELLQSDSLAKLASKATAWNTSLTLHQVHIVRFDSANKIEQIRLYWDQGSLLKAVEAIGGARGRNWPIRDGGAQLKTISNSITSTTNSQDANGSAPRGRENGHRKRESVTATNDPHASLSLFAKRDPNEDEIPRFRSGVAMRESAKPAPRDYGELFAGEDIATKGSIVRSPSPTKADGVILKAGAGKHFTNNRLFDENDEQPRAGSPERKKTFSQKHEHFQFGDGEDAPGQSRPMSSKSNKATTQINFEDFSTPPKVQEKPRPDYERHWGAGVDDDMPPSPPKRPIVHAARPDAESQFKFTDRSSPAPEKAKSLQRQRGMGLYDDTMNDYGDDVAPKKPLNTITNVNNNRRGQDFDNPHYSITDASPAPKKNDKNSFGDQPKRHGKSTRNDMEAQWGFEESGKTKQIYKTAGNGMGGRKGEGRAWGIGDSDPEDETNVTNGHNRQRSDHGAGYGRQRRTAAAEAGAERGFWDTNQ